MKMFAAKRCDSQAVSSSGTPCSALLLAVIFLFVAFFDSPLRAQVLFDVRYDSVTIQIN